jgi:hypothetical protein
VNFALLSSIFCGLNKSFKISRLFMPPPLNYYSYIGLPSTSELQITPSPLTVTVFLPSSVISKTGFSRIPYFFTARFMKLTVEVTGIKTNVQWPGPNCAFFLRHSLASRRPTNACTVLNQRYYRCTN